MGNHLRACVCDYTNCNTSGGRRTVGHDDNITIALTLTVLFCSAFVATTV